MSFLLDTNVLSALCRGSRCNGEVRRWFETVDDAELHTSASWSSES